MTRRAGGGERQARPGGRAQGGGGGLLIGDLFGFDERLPHVRRQHPRRCRSEGSRTTAPLHRPSAAQSPEPPKEEAFYLFLWTTPPIDRPINTLSLSLWGMTAAREGARENSRANEFENGKEPINPRRGPFGSSRGEQWRVHGLLRERTDGGVLAPPPA